MALVTTEVAKKEYVTYPVRFEKPLYDAAADYCTVEEIPLSQYLRKLVKEDLKQRGKWPVSKSDT